MKGVTSDVIAEVRGRASILEVVSEHVVLKRAGKEHRGLCPFHNEKTPSFHVNPQKGIFKCFGCGEGGDVFAFIQKVKRLDFLDAVRDLAQRYGINLVESAQDQQQHDRRTAMLMFYQQAAEYYWRLLRDPRQGVVARQYLASRGITEETVDRFKLGYAPNVWDGLMRYLGQASKAAPQTLEEAGLIRRKADSTSFYDLFRNRLMIPITDDQGRVIAFGGRTLGDDQVKYLNSPESPIYTKGEHLFAFHLAKEAIKSRDRVIVVEGYFDAIMAHQHGFNETVATLGTALTEHQARLVVRYTESKRVYLSFDADAAGERAVERGVDTLSQIAEGVGVELRVIRVPGGKDPDECLRLAGVEAFREAIESAALLVDYRLERAVEDFDLSTHTARIEAARRVVTVLAQIKNAVARGEYVRQWANRLRVREEELLADVGQLRRQQRLNLPAQPPRPAGQARGARALPAGYLAAERQLLALYLTSRDDHARAYDALINDTFIDPVHERIKQALEGIGTQFNNMEDLQYRLQDRLAGDQEASRQLVEVILKAEELRRQGAPADVILKEGRVRLLLERLNRESARLRLSLAAAGDDDELDAISSKIGQLKQLEALFLPHVRSAEDLTELKSKIDEILGVGGHDKRLETRA